MINPEKLKFLCEQQQTTIRKLTDSLDEGKLNYGKLKNELHILHNKRSKLTAADRLDSFYVDQKAQNKKLKQEIIRLRKDNAKLIYKLLQINESNETD